MPAKTSIVTIAQAGLTTCLLMNQVFAATPGIALESDPRTSLICTIDPAGTLTASGYVMSFNAQGNGEYLYETAFDPLTWSGSLKKRRLAFDQTAGATMRVSAVDWDAADLLNGIDFRTRRIYTSTIASDKSFITVPFVWDRLSAAQKTLLNTSPIISIDDQLGEKRLDYLRGNRQFETGETSGIFRPRRYVLGDIVNSQPVFVGAPSGSTQGSIYQTFHDANQRRQSAVYVGGNDGMLHAFSAENGAELFAYIPTALHAGLNRLTQDRYVHRTYVDGRISVAEAQIGTQWKTVLASGMGGGAQGVFTLDVTDPENFDKGLGALWEFTDADDADIGNVVDAPAIARFKTKIVKGVAEYRYFVVVTSGLNNYANDGKFNANAPNVLFLLSLDKDRSEKWMTGVNYFKFSIPVSDKNMVNGLSQPTLVNGSDGATKYAYAGDLQGNVWRFDFTGVAPWPNALGGTSPSPIFTAKDDYGTRQPITQQPNVVFAPGGYAVLVGTGKLLEASDLDSRKFGAQSFYSILDAPDQRASVIQRNQLSRRTLTRITSGDDAFEINGNPLNYGAAGKGWYVDFIDSNHTGERSIHAAQIIDSEVFFNTVIPSGNPCTPATGRSYFVNTLTGLSGNANATGYLTNAGMTTVPMLVSVTSSEVTPSDGSGKRKVKKKIGALDTGPAEKPLANPQKAPPPVELTTTAGRLSWRELVNWIELRTSTSFNQK
jgi:type IV pilus assembly protein PilY1